MKCPLCRAPVIVLTAMANFGLCNPCWKVQRREEARDPWGNLIAKVEREDAVREAERIVRKS